MTTHFEIQEIFKIDPEEATDYSEENTLNFLGILQLQFGGVLCMKNKDLKVIEEHIQSVYSSLFLIAITKKVNLRSIAEQAAQEVNNYLDKLDHFVPTGVGGIMFLTVVAQMMDYSLYDVLFMPEEEIEELLEQIVDEIDLSDLYDYEFSEDKSYFVFDYIFDDEEGEKVDYELTFVYEDDYCKIISKIYIDKWFGFKTDYMHDDPVLWEGDDGYIFDYITESIEKIKWNEENGELEEEEEEQEEEEQEEEEEEDVEAPIDFKDFFIHSHRKNCNHDYITVMATVPIYSNWKVKTITFEAEYCAECGVYYIPESVYQNKILPAGRLLCQVLSADEYYEYKKQTLNNYDDLKPQSILNMLGYNVNSKENLSEHERQTILKYAIENGIITKKMTIGYLKWFIKRNGANRGMAMSVSKWKKDLQWILDFDKKGDIIYGVKRIITD